MPLLLETNVKRMARSSFKQEEQVIIASKLLTPVGSTVRVTNEELLEHLRTTREY